MPSSALRTSQPFLDGHLPPPLEIEAELCRRNFREFIKRSWKIVEPGRQFVPGWHIDAIADHLQACVRGQIRRLIINIPPRHMKSISAAVDLAPWAWIEAPHTQFAYFSYAHNLSLRDSVKSRRLIQSHWYQDRFGGRYALTGDQNAKHRYENDHNGYRLTSSIDGIGTGDGGDIIICFPAGTLIATEHGSMDIAAIVHERRDIRVWSMSRDGKLELKPLLQYHTSKGGDILEIELNSGEVIRCTPNHPIWIDGRGWVRADECQTGESPTRLCDLRQDRVQASESASSSHLLLPNMFSDKREATLLTFLQEMRGLRERVHAQTESASSLLDMFSRMLKSQLGYLEKEAKGNGILSHLWQGGATQPFSLEDLSYLFTGLRPSLEFTPSDGGPQWAMDRWSSTMERSDPRARWNGLRGLQNLALDERSPARRSSHSTRQEPPVLSNSLPSMSQETSRRVWIKDIRCGGRVHEVYNLEVADNHTYFANGVLVHNCDDPHNVREAESDKVRQGVCDWWDDTMQTRLNDPKTGVFIVIMQRVHALDLSGHILKEKGYDHLCLPAEYERNHPFPVRSSIGFKDPRKKEGEPLWAARFGADELLDLKMTAYARAGQLQQRPSPRGGAILLAKWWRKWDLQKFKMPRFTGIYQSYDCAMTEEDRENASYSARTTWGTFNIDGQPQVMLLDRWRDRVPYYELRKEAKRSYKQFKPDAIVVENKVAGISLVQDLRMAGLPVVKYTPDRDKDARAHSASILLETGKVWYIDAPWSKDVIDWCAAFPAGDGEDIVDTVTQIWLRLRNQWFIVPGDVESQIEEDEEDKPTPKPRKAVYG